MENEYISPTIKRPVFIAECRDFGTIWSQIYKQWTIGNLVGDTYALNLTDAIVNLHQFIVQYEAMNSKSIFEIFMINGQLNKYGEIKYQKVYSINGKQAKNFCLVK